MCKRCDSLKILDDVIVNVHGCKPEDLPAVFARAPTDKVLIPPYVTYFLSSLEAKGVDLSSINVRDLWLHISAKNFV